ncbi:hypothetical protein Bca101_045739 [Brassica carinata]
MAVLKRQCGLPPFQLLSFRFVFKSAFRNLVDWFHWPLLVLFFCLIVPLPPDAIYDNGKLTVLGSLKRRLAMIMKTLCVCESS